MFIIQFLIQFLFTSISVIRRTLRVHARVNTIARVLADAIKKESDASNKARAFMQMSNVNNNKLDRLNFCMAGFIYKAPLFFLALLFILHYCWDWGIVSGWVNDTRKTAANTLISKLHHRSRRFRFGQIYNKHTGTSWFTLSTSTALKLRCI